MLLASMKCRDCGEEPVLGVYCSAAGWYIGTYCRCGPYSRESDYYPTEEQAKRALLIRITKEEECV